MTNFEGYTHAQLHAMIESLDPAKVQALGAKLTEAAKTIETIGTKLKDHKVKGWEGEAATAFQNWVSQAGSATLQLAEYSTAGGKYMAEAAQVMREVKPSKEGTGNFLPTTRPRMRSSGRTLRRPANTTTTRTRCSSARRPGRS